MKKPTNLISLSFIFFIILTSFSFSSFGKSSQQEEKHRSKKPYKLPVAAFTATQKTFTSPFKVRFDGSASASPVGLKIKKYFWQFGDRPNDKCSDRDLDQSKHNAIIENTYKKVGSYYVTLTVLDERGGRNSVSKKITVTQAQVNQPPVLKLTIKPNSSGVAPFLALIDGSETISPQGLALNYQFNFGDGNFINSTTPMVTHEYKTAGQYTLTFKAIDSAGQIGSLTALITVTNPVIPADPAITAPAMITTAPQALAQQIQFIYQGPNAVQTGVTSGAIVRSSLIHGIVKDAFGNPLAGVKVTVLNKPNLGQTFSQASGEYDLVVNSGDETILNYERSGYTSSQRRIIIDMPDYATAPEVTLTTLDNKMTTIAMTATSPKQTHTASPVVDSDGQRTPMILFKPGTTASLVLADGSSVSMPQISVRTTEYTVGDQGPKMMPGDLPPNSAYTYAVELSSDEALALGATSVEFSKPYIYFVDNFINVPVGSAVPLGIYNKAKGYWEAERDGVVIKILSIANDVAQIDLSGSGQPATAAQMQAWGVDNDELTTLAAYPVGKTLWRFRISHFSSFDGNFLNVQNAPFVSNNVKKPVTPCTDAACKKCGACVIDIGSRVWLETISLMGINQNLHYSSERTFGFSGNSSVTINLVTNEYPESLRSIEVDAKVAGTSKKTIILPGEDTNYKFTWDGLDAFGREVTQATNATISVTYYFQSDYFIFPAQPDGTTFNAPWSNVVGTVVPSRKAFTVVQDIPVLMSPPKLFESEQVKNEIGGWTFEQHHQYNAVTKKLSLGTGQVIDSKSLSPIVTNIAGGGQNTGDGSLALNSKLVLPTQYLPQPDGSAYITELGNSRVRKISSTGIISTIAGTGVSGSAGDNGLATQAKIGDVLGLTVAADGSIYLADLSMHVIRKISPNGIISTIAGTSGVPGYSGDNGPANLAKINNPAYIISLSDGSILFSEIGNNVLRQILPNGIIRTYAGDGTRGYSGDNGPAALAKFNEPTGITTDANGAIYVADSRNNVIRKIAPGGMITTVVGNGTAGFSGDNGPAIQAQLIYPIGIAVTSRGEIYLTDANNSVVRFVDLNNNIKTVAGISQFFGYDGGNQPADNTIFNFPLGISLMPDETLIIVDRFNELIRKMSSPAPQIINTQYRIPSTDGSEVFVFDLTGKHLQTLFAKTGQIKWQFNYNVNNQLISFSDLNQNSIQITRNGNGQATQITGPYGQIYNVTIDSNGYLQRITQPTSEAYQIESTNEGLITKFTKPKGNFSTISYNGDGTLLQDIDTGGGTLTLAIDSNNKVTMTSALGRKRSIQQESLPWSQSSSKLLTEEADGTKAEIIKTGGLSQRTDNTGVTFSHMGYDSRLLSNAQYNDGALIRTASLGKETSMQTSRNYTVRSMFDFDMTEITTKDNQSTITMSYSSNDLAYKTVTGGGRYSKTVIDSQERPVLVQNAEFLPQQMTYDSRGRLSQMQQGSRITTYGYDARGYLNRITDPIGRITTFENDLSGKILKTILPDNRIILSSYDINSNLTNLNLPNSQDHQSIFNNFDILASYIAPQISGINSTTNYAYNLDRQPSSIQRPDNQVISYQYDGSFNRTKVIGTGTQFFNYNYDTKARLVSVLSSDNVRINYDYDGTIPIQKTYQFENIVITTNTSYSNPGLLIESESINGQNLNRGYDADQLPTNHGDQSLVRSLTSGLVNTANIQNVTKSFQYNSFSELQSHSTIYASVNVFSENFSRDNIGRITQKTEVLNNVSTVYNYSYDLSGRLTQVRRNNVLISNYIYDQNSNRVAKNNIASTYDVQDRIITSGNNVYTFNDHGDLETKTNGPQSTTYSFDVFGQLKTVNLPNGNVVSYKTDGENKRFSRLVNGVVQTMYSYNNQGQLVSEHNADGTLRSRYIYGTQAHSPDYMIKNNVKYSLIKDHLGSIRLVMNTTTGAIAQQLNYDEFGIVTLDTNPQFQTFGYAGGLYDSSTGLLRFGAREYDAESGRWLQKDPIRFQGGDTNLYGYVKNNPINLIDPSGLQNYCPDPLTEMTNMLERLFPAAVDRVITNTAYVATGVAATGGLVLFGPELLAIGLANPALTTDAVITAVGTAGTIATGSSLPFEPANSFTGGVVNAIGAAIIGIFGD